MAQGGVAPVSGSTIAGTPCICYCLTSWIAPINPVNPDVPDPGQPTVTGWTNQTETEEAGWEFWTANVNQKTYVCETRGVVSIAALVLNLGHNRYTITRTRSLRIALVPKTSGPWTITIGPWTITIPAVTILVPTPFWTPWTAPARVPGPVVSAQAALATSSPPSLPVCTDVGVACP